MVGEDPVVFLRHLPVIGAQPRFHVGDRRVEFDRRERPGDGRVRITKDQQAIGPFVNNHLFYAGEHLRRLHAVRPRSDAKVDIRLGDAHLAKEDRRHSVVIVLPGMNEDFPVARATNRPAHGRRFNELGPGSNDGDYLHFSLSPCFVFLYFFPHSLHL